MRSLDSIRVVLVLTVALSAGACDEGRPLSAPPDLGPATQEQAEAYGERLLEGLRTCNSRTLSTVFDLESLATIALRQSTLNNRLQQEFLSAVQHNRFQQLGDLFQCRDEEYAAGFVVEGIRNLDGKPAVVIGNFAQGSLLWQFPVGTTPGGQVVARDFFDYSQGSLMTSIFTDYDNLVAGDSYNQATVIEVLGALREGEPASLERMSELTKASRTNRKMQISELQVRAYLGAEEYKAARARFYKRYPKHDALHLLTQAALTNAGDSAGALEAIDALDAQIGGVPGLDLLRLGVIEEMNAPLQLLETAKRAVRAMPNRDDSWFWLLEAQQQTKDHEGMLATMKEIGERFETIWDRSAPEDEFFAEFATTPHWEAYHAWLGESFELDTEEETAAGP